MMTKPTLPMRCQVVCPASDESGPAQRCQLREHDDARHAARTFVAKHHGDTFLRWSGDGSLIVGVWPDDQPPLAWATGMPTLEGG